MKLRKLLFSKRFWITFLLVLVVCIVVDLIISIVVISKALTSNQWSNQIKMVSILYVVFNILGSRNLKNSYQFKMIARVILIVGFVWAVEQIDFIHGIYFILINFVAARILRIIIKIVEYQSLAIHKR